MAWQKDLDLDCVTVLDFLGWPDGAGVRGAPVVGACVCGAAVVGVGNVLVVLLFTTFFLVLVAVEVTVGVAPLIVWE